MGLTFVSAIMASAQTPAPSQREVIDLGMYARIQAEGFNHSRVMEYAGALDEDIGPRLTGSPEMAKANTWTRDTLTAMGCTNAHLEDWGEFGMGWEQRGSPLLMVAPEPAVFIAQAAPWSPGTVGANGKLSSLRATTSTASTRLPKPPAPTHAEG